jgi:putative restriction endonuclease
MEKSTLIDLIYVNPLLRAMVLPHFNQDKGDRHPSVSYNRAPHKPCLLLAVARGFSVGRISGREIVPDSQLVRDFGIFSKSVDGKPRELRLPFFHMRTEGYWRLIRSDGSSSHNDKAPKTIKALRETYSAAEIDESLVLRLSDQSLRRQLVGLIIEVNFHHSIHDDILHWFP